MFGAWTGPHRSVSNLSRWATRLHIRRVPVWLSAGPPTAGRSAAGSLRWCCCSRWRGSFRRRADDAERRRQGRTATPLAPPDKRAVPHADRHVDTDLKNAILVHVPKTRQVRIVVLKDDPEADQFSWEIDAFLRAEGYTVVPRLFFAMAAGGKMPSRNHHLS